MRPARDAYPLHLFVGFCRPWLVASVVGALLGSALLSVEGSEPSLIYEELLARSVASETDSMEAASASPWNFPPDKSPRMEEPASNSLVPNAPASESRGPAR